MSDFDSYFGSNEDTDQQVPVSSVDHPELIEKKEVKAKASGNKVREKSPANDRIKSKKRRTKGDIIRTVIIIICAIIFCYSGIRLLGILLEYNRGKKLYGDVTGQITEDNTPVEIVSEDGNVSKVPFKYDHNALLAINADAQGMLYVPSVDMRLPVVQGTDNEKYLTTAIDGSSNINGCLFIDYRINGGINSSHVIIYGHTLYSGTMFSALHKYRNSGFYQTEGNDKFYIYTKDRLREYQIFSVYLTDPTSETFTFNFPTLSSMQSYAVARKQESMYATNGDPSTARQIVTLSTCADNLTHRLIIHGSLIGETSIPQSEPSNN